MRNTGYHGNIFVMNALILIPQAIICVLSLSHIHFLSFMSIVLLNINTELHSHSNVGAITKWIMFLQYCYNQKATDWQTVLFLWIGQPDKNKINVIPFTIKWLFKETTGLVSYYLNGFWMFHSKINKPNTVWCLKEIY